MTVAAIMLVKDEADVIADVVRHTKGQVDEVIVADNGSTDGTREIVEGAGVDLLIDDSEVGYFQERKMSHLAKLAGGRGADWIVPVDADEIWAARDGRLGDILDSLPETVMVAQAVLYDQVATGKDRVGVGVSGMGWRQLLPLPMRKVACRYRDGLRILPGNHAAVYPDVVVAPAALDLLVVRHFPYRSPRQFISKVRNGAAAYAATDLPPDTGAHKREFGRVLEALGEDGLRELFYERFFVKDPTGHPDLVFDPCQ